LALASMPLLILIRGEGFGYQFYKLFLSISPILVIGFLLVEEEAEKLFIKTKIVIFLMREGAMILLVFICLGTGDMVIRSGIGTTMAEIGRGGAQKLLTPATMELQAELSRMHDKSIYIIWYDEFYNGNFVNAWLAYFARNNRVWLSNTLLSDIDIRGLAKKIQRPQDIFTEGFLLTSSKLSQPLKNHGAELVWAIDPYYLWKFSVNNEGIFKIIKPQLKSRLMGFGSVDLVNLSETAGGDNHMDAVFKLHVMTSGTIGRIEVRNIDGMHSVWDTVPGNGEMLLGVSDIDRSGVLLNKSDGSVDISVHDSKKLLLYAADNSSFKNEETHYQVAISFVDGRSARTLVRK